MGGGAADHAAAARAARPAPPLPGPGQGDPADQRPAAAAGGQHQQPRAQLGQARGQRSRRGPLQEQPHCSTVQDPDTQSDFSVCSVQWS